MTDTPSMPRFSLKTLFLWTAFVGLGLFAMKYPYDWVLPIVNTAFVLLFAYGVAAAFVCTGRRRLFWIVFCSSMLLAATTAVQAVVWKMEMTISAWLHPVVNQPPGFGAFGDEGLKQISCSTVVRHFAIVMQSTIAAYIIPWLVQRGQRSD